jgi:DNA-binding PadR family transcriptional regulator
MNWQWGFPFDFPLGFEGPGGRARGPRRGFFRSGEVRLALLSLLAEEPGHGYQLMKRLEERSGGLYRASPGAVYPVLQQLEDEGLVRVSEEEAKKIYEITDEGRAELEQRAERVERIWRRARQWHDWSCRMGPDTVEVAMSVGRLAKAALGVAAQGSQETADKVVEALRRARTEIEDLTS